MASLTLVMLMVCLAGCKTTGIFQSEKEAKPASLSTVPPKIKVPYLKQLDGKTPDVAIAILNHRGTSGRIDCLNWSAQFSYKPSVTFRIARSRTHIFIKYTVQDELVKAVYGNDQDPVWKDSCVEFFCKRTDQTVYTNLEFNCIGTCLSEIHPSSTQSYYRPEDEMKQILRYSTLGNKTFDEKQGSFNWELTVAIPFQLLGVDPSHLPEKIMGNFYKCGDGTSRKHYVSWSPIVTPSPSFHRPEFFGELLLR